MGNASPNLSYCHSRKQVGIMTLRKGLKPLVHNRGNKGL